MSRFIVLFSAVLFAVGCDQQSTPVVFNVASLPTVAFNAPDMMCPDGCGVKVKEILSEQPGVKEVVVDFDGKTATVAIGDNANFYANVAVAALLAKFVVICDPRTAKFDADAAVAALVDHGFKNSSVKSDATEGAPAKPQAAGTN